MLMAQKKHGARTAATTVHAPLPTENRQANTRRWIVPQLGDLAGLVSGGTLATLRTEVQAGERVAIYTRRRLDTGRQEVRVVITGPERQWTLPPSSVDTWRRVGVVEITEDGERALPELAS